QRVGHEREEVRVAPASEVTTGDVLRYKNKVGILGVSRELLIPCTQGVAVCSHVDVNKQLCQKNRAAGYETPFGMYRFPYTIANTLERKIVFDAICVPAEDQLLFGVTDPEESANKNMVVARSFVFRYLPVIVGPR